MGRRLKLTGLKFNRWEVIRFSAIQYNQTVWTCRCICGTIRDVQGNSLTTGKSKSCGCYKTEQAKYNMTKFRTKYTGQYYKEFLGLIKALASCQDCGKKYLPCQMDFDHVRGEKIFQLAGMQNRTRDQIFNELDKCELVCSNCHRLRTMLRRRRYE